MVDGNAFIFISLFFIGGFAKQETELLALSKAQEAYYQQIEAEKYIREYISYDFDKYKEILTIGRMVSERKFVFQATFP